MKILLRKRQIFSSFKPLHEITLDVIIVLNSSFPTLQISGNRTVKKWNDDLFNDLFQAFIRFFFKGKKTHLSLSLSLSSFKNENSRKSPSPRQTKRRVFPVLERGFTSKGVCRVTMAGQGVS